MRAGARGRQGEGYNALEIEFGVLMGEVPAIGKRLVGLNRQHFTIQNAAPFAPQFKAMTDGELEIVLHQPFLDQMRLSERAPKLLWRMRNVAFNNDGAQFGRMAGHWSIL